MRRLWKDKKIIARFQNVTENKFPIIRYQPVLKKLVFVKYFANILLQLHSKFCLFVSLSFICSRETFLN